MNKNTETVEEVDETRVAIAAKIEDKKKATHKLEDKSESLETQIVVYEKAIVKHEEKLRAAKERLEQFKVSKLGNDVELTNRQEEIGHMVEILDRYDKALAERAKAVKTIQERIEAVPDWYPGMDESLRGAFKQDAKYKKAVERRNYLDLVLSNSLSDVRKIYIARGVVSDYNVKGRKGV